MLDTRHKMQDTRHKAKDPREMNDIDVLYEDNHLIVVNKAVSDLVQGDRTGDISLDQRIKEYIKKKYNKPGDVYLGVAHRLDRPVTGAVIFARTSKALVRLNKMFQEQEIKKFYWAVVKDRPEMEEAELVNFLRRNPDKNKSFVSQTSKKDAKEARMKYTLKGVTNNYYFLEVELFTGRHHQIRCQLGHIGSPVKGDMKYGFPRSNKGGGIHLHARQVTFIHPVKKELLTILANPPREPLWDEFLLQAGDSPIKF